MLAVRQPEAVAASLVSRDQLPLDRALLLLLSHTLEAERATRQLLGAQPITTPSAELLGHRIRPDHNHHQRSSGGLELQSHISATSCTSASWTLQIIATVTTAGFT